MNRRPMDFVALQALEIELTRGRHDADGCFGRALQILHRLQDEWREQQRAERLTNAERRSLEAAE